VTISTDDRMTARSSYSKDNHLLYFMTIIMRAWVDGQNFGNEHLGYKPEIFLPNRKSDEADVELR
jgi:hypothetical protein